MGTGVMRRSVGSWICVAALCAACSADDAGDGGPAWGGQGSTSVAGSTTDVDPDGGEGSATSAAATTSSSDTSGPTATTTMTTATQGGSSDGDSSEGGSGEVGSSSGGGVDLGECPAPEVVTLSEWTDAPWVAPTTGNAQQEFRLSTENWLHYGRFELDMDIDVTEVGDPYNCFLELRNTGAPQGETFPWRYFSVCTKNDPPRRMVHVPYAAENTYLVTDFTLQANTRYHVNVVFDSWADETTLTMTPEGGEATTILSSPLVSSIAPMGQGLDLWVGFRTSHPDFPTILPPWGWSFSNLEVTLEPGGAFGPLAPACP